MKLIDQRAAARMARGSALVRRQTIDLALDRKQRIDLLDGLDRDRRFLQSRDLEQLASRMRPAADLGDRTRLARSLVEPVEAGIGIGLHRSGIGRKMRLWMGAGAVGRVEEHGGRRRVAREGTIVPHIGPYASRARLALGQNRNSGVVGVDALGSEDMRLDRLDQRHQRRSRRADPVGQRGDVERHALMRIRRALPVERQVQSVFGE